MLTIHLMKVNNVSKEVIYAYREKLFKSNKTDGSIKSLDAKLKYCIEEGIPYKKELEDYLKKRDLLHEES